MNEKEPFVDRYIHTRIPVYKCLRCGGKWIPRIFYNKENGEIYYKKPNHCTHCNSPYWDKERQIEIEEEERIQAEIEMAQAETEAMLEAEEAERMAEEEEHECEYYDGGGE